MNRFAALVACMLVFMTAQACQTSDHDDLQAAFTPEDDVEGLLIRQMEQAHKQILVQAYLFTDHKIAAALVEAHRRGVDVRVLGDAEQESRVEGSLLSLLSAAGIPVWLQTKYQNAHDKIVLIDPELPDGTVITGSFNFTWTAQHRNAENMLAIHGNRCLSSQFLANWQKKRADAVPFKK